MQFRKLQLHQQQQQQQHCIQHNKQIEFSVFVCIFANWILLIRSYSFVHVRKKEKKKGIETGTLIEIERVKEYQGLSSRARKQVNEIARIQSSILFDGRKFLWPSSKTFIWPSNIKHTECPNEREIHFVLMCLVFRVNERAMKSKLRQGMKKRSEQENKQTKKADKRVWWSSQVKKVHY